MLLVHRGVADDVAQQHCVQATLAVGTFVFVWHRSDFVANAVQCGVLSSEAACFGGEFRVDRVQSMKFN